MSVIYGIKNCDTMKKAFAWLESNAIEYKFHDYKKSGIDEGAFRLAVAEHGWESVINRRGTTWRNLPDAIKNHMNDEKAVSVARDHPAIIKRPLLVHNGSSYLGFEADIYDAIFSQSHIN